ncbi:hypothetical protein ACHAWF_014829 [Thalassiosira exigua]
MLNYYLGKRAADEGRDSRYPDIDFCRDPGAVCSRDDHPELKWIAGMFYWVRSLQTYDEGWNYISNLKAFVRGGMQDDSFIDAVSGIVNRGCHNPPCGTGPLDGGYERKENFKKVLEVLFEENGSPRKFRPVEDVPTYFPSPPPLESSNYGSSEALHVEEIPTAEREEVSEGEDWSQLDAGLSNGPNEVVVEDEEDWSNTDEGQGSVMSLYCGKTQSEAFANCGRNGYDCQDGVCFNGMKCFMTESCDDDKEVSTRLPTRRPVVISTRPPTAKPTPRPVAAQLEDAPQPSAENIPTETSVAQEISPANNIGLQQNYCAKSKAALEMDCVTATTCTRSEDCPPGTYCWADHLCGGVPATVPGPPQSPHPPKVVPLPTYMPTYTPTPKPSLDVAPPSATTPEVNEPTNDQEDQPSVISSIQFDITNTFFCGTDRVHASTSCHKRCRDGSSKWCDEGENCFGYTSCEAEIPRAPATESEEQKEPAKMPTVHLEPSANTPIIPKQSQEIIPSPAPKVVEQFPDVSQSSSAAQQQLLCASSALELELSCASAQSCSGGPCPSGMFCFPYVCTVGELLPTTVNAEAPAPVEALQPPPAPTESQPLQDENPQPLPSENENTQYADLCPQSSFDGWYASADCKEYYKCENGAPGVIHVCGNSLKFDKVRNQCYHGQYVNSFCYGPPLGHDQARQQALCGEGHTGWEARLGCKEYYWCDRGRADVVYTCGEGLLFDRTLELCNFAPMVHCPDKGGPSTPPPAPPPTPRPTPATRTLPPTKLNGDYRWSDTAAPTLAEVQSETPPWLMNTIMTETNDSKPTSRPNWFSLVCLSRLILLIL